MGLPTGLLLAKAGYQVKGFDIDQKKIQLLKNHMLPFKETGLETLFHEASNNFHVSDVLGPSDVFIITVPTPLTQGKTCEMGYVTSAVNMVKKVLQDGNLVVLESTVPPGTTSEIVKPLLDETQKSYFLSYVSEKAIPGNTIYEMRMNHRIIGGINRESAEKTKEVYAHFVESPIHLTDCSTAESVKLIENTYRDVNIAFANELAKRLSKMNVNVWDAIRLANFHPRVNLHQPGPGVGGHCIAIDPWFLVSADTPLIHLARCINDRMPSFVVGMIEKMLDGDQDAPIVLFGVAYKGNVDDDRESPSYLIKELLESKGFTVRLFDPLIIDNPGVSTVLSEVTLDAVCLVVVTDHDVFKDIDPIIITNMRRKQIIDTRNLLDHDQWSDAGFRVQVLGG